MRRCSSCKREISLLDAIMGQDMLDTLVDTDVPWVYYLNECEESYLESFLYKEEDTSEFINEKDTELLGCLKGTNYIGRIILHENCIEKDLAEYKERVAARKYYRIVLPDQLKSDTNDINYIEWYTEGEISHDNK